MNYVGTTINESPTIAGITGAAIDNGAGKAVKYDANGKLILCAVAGEASIGVLLLDTPSALASGAECTVQIKEIGTVVAGAAFKKGDPLTVTAAAKVIVATDATISVAGAVGTIANKNFIIGFATSNAGADGDFAQMQITKSGYKI